MGRTAVLTGSHCKRKYTGPPAPNMLWLQPDSVPGAACTQYDSKWPVKTTLHTQSNTRPLFKDWERKLLYLIHKEKNKTKQKVKENDKTQKHVPNKGTRKKSRSKPY